MRNTVTKFELPRFEWAHWPDIEIPLATGPLMIPENHELKLEVMFEPHDDKCRMRVDMKFTAYSDPAKVHCPKVERPFQPEYRRQLRSWFARLQMRSLKFGDKIARRHMMYVTRLPIADANLLTGYYGRRRSIQHRRIWKFAKPVRYVQKHILDFIAAVRNSLHDSVRHYTQGSCYGFGLLLKHQYPEAVLWYDRVEGHVYTRIGDHWYDIRGVHYKRVSKRPLDHTEGHPPHRWRPRNA